MVIEMCIRFKCCALVIRRCESGCGGCDLLSAFINRSQLPRPKEYRPSEIVKAPQLHAKASLDALRAREFGSSALHMVAEESKFFTLVTSSRRFCLTLTTQRQNGACPSRKTRTNEQLP